MLQQSEAPAKTQKPDAAAPPPLPPIIRKPPIFDRLATPRGLVLGLAISIGLWLLILLALARLGVF